LLIINPDSSQIEGIDNFREVTNSFWMNPKFRATHFEVKDLDITFSKNEDVAWFFCLLDDFGEWDGKKIGWENVRWTGVLEKENGVWVLRQMHFSFPEK
nr:nuclear transport factor 2 family protein [Bacteroidota bacterium]